MKLYVSRPIAEPVLEEARARFDVTVGADPLTEEAAAAVLRDYDAVLPTLGDRFTRAAFEAAGEIRARVLGNFGVGYNHIDVAAAADHGVAVSNTPDVLTDATADTGLLLILATARRASDGERMLRAGEWGGFGPGVGLGREVTGKTVGIVGFGRIGQAVGARCHRGFRMPVLYWNRSAKDPGYPAERVADLHELCGRADFVVLCVPGGAETTHLIGAAELAAMKPEGILVNIARGEVVDEAALIEALEAGRIGGAGLDVYENEPEVPDRLRRLWTCTLLPHIGSATVETRQAMAQLALDNIVAFVEGREMPTRVA